MRAWGTALVGWLVGGGGGGAKFCYLLRQRKRKENTLVVRCAAVRLEHGSLRAGGTEGRFGEWLGIGKGGLVCLVSSVWRLELGNADQMAVSNVDYYYYYYYFLVLLIRGYCCSRNSCACSA